MLHSSLAQARDVEASLQEQLLEQFHDLVLARTVTAGSTGRSQAAQAAAKEASELLQPILAVLPAAGAAGAACLGRACAALHVKKRLKGKAIAAGLQTIIQQLMSGQEPMLTVTHGCVHRMASSISGATPLPAAFKQLCSDWLPNFDNENVLKLNVLMSADKCSM